MNVLSTKCEVDFGLWNPTELNLEQFIILSLIIQGKTNVIGKFHQNLNLPGNLLHLETKGYLKITDGDLSISNITESIELRMKALELFSVSNTNTSDWIEDWRKLFPAGSNPDGFRYRGDKQGCLRKMNKFLKAHRAVSVEQIQEATKKYVERYKQKNYAYMKQAHYFIEKDGISTLASEIESLIENEHESTTTRRRVRILE